MNINNLKYILCLVGFLLIYNSNYAQSNTSRAFQSGNYIFCGKELPKKFSYLIEKELGTNNWKSVAELKAPVNIAECKARMMQLPSSLAELTSIDANIINFVWKRIEKSNQLDSLYMYSVDPRYQSIAGVAWFDTDIKLPGQYRYRINKLSRAGVITKLNEITVAFPAEPFKGKAKPVRYKFHDNSIDLSYDVSDKENTLGLKLFRANYLQKNYLEISPSVYFTSQKEKMVALLTDNSAIKGFTYSYLAVPYDFLGNTGIASDTLNIYYLAKPADLGLITNFEVKPKPEQGGNLLKWIYNAKTNVASIEVFRSNSYTDNYKRIASLSATQNEYFDALRISPAITYYYYISINNGMGNSLPSARVPAILMGNKQNLIPPQDLTISRKDRIVTLQFRKVGHDVRAYYIYRGDGYIAPLIQHPRMLLSTDSLLTFNDTLPLSVSPSVYSYAVASVNTSYSISPMSERVNTSFSGGRLPIPDNLNAVLRNNEIFVSWSDVAKLNSAITGYQIFRKTSRNNQVIEPEKLIATTDFETNFFVDKMVSDNHYFTYRIQSVGTDTTDLSSLSLPTGAVYPKNVLLQPGEVLAMAADKKILLKWTLPQNEPITSVFIYRAIENGNPELINESIGNIESFEDLTAKKGVRYYYFIKLKYKNNQESDPTDAVSAKW